ncbi:MAG: hypothetical protein WB791_07580 [Waddliaceae bacterium]
MERNFHQAARLPFFPGHRSHLPPFQALIQGMQEFLSSDILCQEEGSVEQRMEWIRSFLFDFKIHFKLYLQSYLNECQMFYNRISPITPEQREGNLTHTTKTIPHIFDQMAERSKWLQEIPREQLVSSIEIPDDPLDRMKMCLSLMQQIKKGIDQMKSAASALAKNVELSVKNTISIEKCYEKKEDFELKLEELVDTWLELDDIWSQWYDRHIKPHFEETPTPPRPGQLEDFSENSSDQETREIPDFSDSGEMNLEETEGKTDDPDFSHTAQRDLPPQEPSRDPEVDILRIQRIRRKLTFLNLYNRSTVKELKQALCHAGWEATGFIRGSHQKFHKKDVGSLSLYGRPGDTVPPKKVKQVRQAVGSEMNQVD